MQCVFINLDRATDRRASIETNLAKHAPDWPVTRFAAMRAETARDTPGSIRDGEKGCFLSHRAVIRAAIGSPEHVLVLEDDARLGPSTRANVAKFLNGPARRIAWDLLFCDVAVTRPETMAELAALRRELIAEGSLECLDLSRFAWAGSSAYLINPASAQRIAALLDQPRLDLPYDLALRGLIHDRRVRAFVAFPFVTTVARDADASQLQHAGTAATDLVWNTFRRMTWCDADPSDTAADLDQIKRDVCEPESDQIGTLVSACLSRRFVRK